MTRQEFQQLAEYRIEDAGILLNTGRFSAAYYLSGLAIECGLKACIASKTKADDFPDKNRTNNAWNHDLEKLLITAEIKSNLDAKVQNSNPFRDNWNTVKQWQVDSRYDPGILESDARALYESATDPQNGVFTWLRSQW